jgi:hypothetical protein
MDKENRVNLDMVHPGYAAQRSLPQNAGRTVKKTAYNNAMRLFQDRYYEQVGLVNAQLRFGPRRTRMTRVEWITAKKHAELLSKSVNGYKDENMNLKKKLKQLISNIKNIFTTRKENTKTKKIKENNYE